MCVEDVEERFITFGILRINVFTFKGIYYFSLTRIKL